MDKGLLGGHNKENANEGDRHSQYSKKGSNSQELPPTPEQGKSILLDLLAIEPSIKPELNAHLVKVSVIFAQQNE